jgi:adenosylcobinamide kinase/adenosylcobinamide-phosphate guanylyltransferase
MNKNETILILGGARSGKSDLAVQLALRFSGKVAYVATASAGDEEMKERIKIHKQNRPASWSTIEAETGIGTALRNAGFHADVIILDCLTMLVSNIILVSGEETKEQILIDKAIGEIEQFLKVCRENNSRSIIVSNETGMGIVPPSRLGRVYRDVLGKANKHIALKADKVLLMFAGLAIDIKKISENSDYY